MLIQATSPRIVLNSAEDPKHICVHTLRKQGVSKGEVLFGAFATGGRLPPGSEEGATWQERLHQAGRRLELEEHLDGNRQDLTVYRHAPVRRDSNARILEPQEVYQIEGEEGFQALVYVLPFWELFREEDKNHNLKLVPFCTGGFSVTVRSAFRSDPRTYDEHVLTFLIMMPVTGGGIIRLGDTPTDISNSTFDPWAPDPKRPWKNLELQDAYNRTHRLGDRPAIDKRREERIRAAEASMAAEAAKTGRMLPPKP
jgi:hypothetical protein